MNDLSFIAITPEKRAETTAPEPEKKGWFTRLKEGLKADINVVDYENLALGAPEMVRDLPAGGQRLLQPARGFRASLVSGRQVISNDQVTDERPGRLVRFN